MYINIGKDYKDFFSHNIEKKQDNGFSDIYKVCMEDKCINVEDFNKDIKYINYAINNVYSIEGVLLFNNNLIKILEKKKILNLEYVDINYNFELYAQKIMNTLYNDHLNNIDFGDSVFLSKKQFDLYLREYIFFSYNKILNNNISDIKKSKYSKYSILGYLINREYIYNRLFINSSVMYSYGTIINNINNDIQKIKGDI